MVFHDAIGYLGDVPGVALDAAPAAAQLAAEGAAGRRRWWRSHWFHSVLYFALFYVLAPYDILKSLSLENGHTLDVREAVDRYAEANPVRNLVILALGIWAMVSLMQPSANRLRIRGFMGLAIVGFLCWAMASPLWGEDPLTTGRRVVGLVFLCLAALAMARQCEGDGLLQFVIFSLGLFAVSGIAAELAIGSFHPLDPSYRFAGLVHPNAMGGDCALLSLASLVYARRRAEKPLAYVLIAAIAVVLLVLTKSRTALLAWLAGVACGAVLLSDRRTRGFLVLGILATVTTVLAFDHELYWVLSGALALGRTDSGASDIGSFTGRSDIWAQLWGYVMQRPLTGYGYNSFWSPNRLLDVALAQGFASPSAHSGLLEVTLSLGLVGGGIFAVVLLSGVVRALGEYARRGLAESAFVAAALVTLCVNITTESIVLHPTIGSFIWMIMLARLGFVEEPGGARAEAR
ncbi:MAG TPA: O-antigen ligase family protein [Gemmatimonadales bacterium]|nr:O-antigen ligase family protein [Gemmatimonadales bacterium]